MFACRICGDRYLIKGYGGICDRCLRDVAPRPSLSVAGLRKLTDMMDAMTAMDD